MQRREIVKLGTVSAFVATVGATLGNAPAAVAQDEQTRKESAPIKRGCACNASDRDIVAYITSAHGVVSLFVQKGQCAYFNFVDDGKKRVLSAFSQTNELVAYFAFVPLDDACVLIENDAKEPKKRSERSAPKDPVTTKPV
ncbi:MAG: hypothetical protein ACTHK7_00050 [Aureliella sp.]